MASHAIEHQHHSAQSHTTGICAWMCTAAQSISTDYQVFSPTIDQLDILPHFPISSTPSPWLIFLPSRGPPI